MGIAGATVYSDTNGVIQGQATTAADGSYTLGGLQAGSRHVVVEKNAYANAHRYNVPVFDNTTTQGIDFVLTTLMGQLAGRVTDHGQALAGVVVLAGGIQGSGYGYDHTDANGYYLITRLAPMDYTVNAWHTDGHSISLDKAVLHNQTTWLDFEFSGQHPGGIRGQILLDSSLPAQQAAVYILPRNSSGTNFAGYSDHSGRYQANSLSPDVYDVHISGMAGYPNMIHALVNVGSNLVTIDFNVQRGDGLISGTVHDPQGQPLVGAKVNSFCWQPNPCTYGEVVTDNQGAYFIPYMWAGTYNTQVDYPAYARVVKNDIQLTGGGSASVNFVMGIPATLIPASSSLTVATAGSAIVYRSLFIDVSSGPQVGWTAVKDPSIGWLYLGQSGQNQQAAGQTGTQGLWLQFHPANAPLGSSTATVSLSSPAAAPAEIEVTLVRTASEFFAYLPISWRR